MKHILLVLLLTCGISTQNFEKANSEDAKPEPQITTIATGPVKDIQTMADVNQWANYYYLRPSPELVVKSILVSERNRVFDRQNGQSALVGLYSQIFAQNPKLLSDWLKDLSAVRADHKAIIWKALWQANTVESRNAANSLVDQFPSISRPPILDESTLRPQPIEKMELTPDVLDTLWAAFFVSGDQRYVARIITALSGHRTGQKDKKKQIAADAAKLSLTTNAHVHKRVMDICIAACQQNPDLKPELEEIIAHANAQSPSH